MERFHLYKVPKVVRHMQTEIRMLVTRGFGRRNGELVFSADRVSDGGDEKFFRQMVVMVVKPCDVYLEIIKTVNFMLCYFTTIKKIYCRNEGHISPMLSQLSAINS